VRQRPAAKPGLLGRGVPPLKTTRAPRLSWASTTSMVAHAVVGRLAVGSGSVASVERCPTPSVSRATVRRTSAVAVVVQVVAPSSAPEWTVGSVSPQRTITLGQAAHG
jgi:hypothetical protein